MDGKIYIGWDSREDIAYQVAKKSIQDNSSKEYEITPIQQNILRKLKIYSRDADTLASTEFTFTRFLVPYLNKFKGWALFCDCDFLFLEDVSTLFDMADKKYAVMLVKHNYKPKNKYKMDGKEQLIYPRKNWSSLVLWNCAHPANAVLTPDLINNIETTGAFLHRFQWLSDKQIGEIGCEWNWLVNWYKEPKDGKPSALHFTEGGPWFENYINCDYANLWLKKQSDYYKNLADTAVANQLQVQEKRKADIEKDIIYRCDPESLVMEQSKKEFMHEAFNFLKDPDQDFYKHNFMDKIKKRKHYNVAAIYPDQPDIQYKNFLCDPILEAFVQGIPNGKISTWNKEKNSSIPLVVRGIAKQSQLAVTHCWSTNRLFYAVDTGYIQPGIHKEYHRITKNNLQYLGPIIDRPDDRFIKLRWKLKSFKKRGDYILLCPPSERVMNFYGQDLDKWLFSTTEEIKSYTDRPIKIREKPKREIRVQGDTIWAALDSAYCLVTFNSIAATEALLYGKPAVALAPNAASILCNTKISEIENLNYPSSDEMYSFAKHLSYCQFNKVELQNGTAWSIVNESS